MKYSIISTLLFTTLSCNGGDRPGTPRPSSHRFGFVRDFATLKGDTPTPPASPVEHDCPKKEWNRDCLGDWATRKRSNSCQDLDDSKATTIMSLSGSRRRSSSDYSISSEGYHTTENGVPVTVVTWGHPDPEPGWYAKLILALKRLSPGSIQTK